MIWFQKF